MTALTIGNPRTKNDKLNGKRPAAATYRTPDTCSPNCWFFRDGKPKCYAASGNGGGSFTLAKKYGKSTKQAFARLLRDTPFKAVVRHLVSGDLTPDYIEEANAFHAERTDLEGYGYTHKWRDLTPTLFEGWTMNASCETTKDVEKAIANGWQAVITSPSDDLLHGTRIAGRKVVTCPNQRTEAVKCSDCRLCLSDTPTRPVIEFIMHGTSVAKNNTLISAIRMQDANQKESK